MMYENLLAKRIRLVGADHPDAVRVQERCCVPSARTTKPIRRTTAAARVSSPPMRRVR